MTVLDAPVGQAEDVETIFTNIRQRIRTASISVMHEIGGLITDELVQRLNIAYPPASSPGQDPHRRIGELSAGIAFNVFELNDGVTCMVTSGRSGGPELVPIWLNYGTSKMAARPYMTKTVEEWQRKFLDEAERLYREALA